MELVGPDDVRAARALIGDALSPTPMAVSEQLSGLTGCGLRLKAENLQKTGSFKVRGALHYLLRSDPERLSRGVVTVSAGNHACAVAWAANQVGAEATVVMPETAPEAKVAACRGYGARVEFRETGRDAFVRALELADLEGMEFMHPFDHPWVVAGQGTCALEILEACPEPDAIVVPVGGGGLIGGVLAAVGESHPTCRVYGVEPDGAAVMKQSLEEGAPVREHTPVTVADGLGAPWAGELPFALVRRFAEDVVTVSDAQIGEALELIVTRSKLLVEPAGAAGVAALLSGAIPVRRDETVVVILSGGNTDLARLPPLIGKACDPCPVRDTSPI